MLGGLAIRKPQSVSSLLAFALACIFLEQGWVIGLGTCNCCYCGSSGSPCYDPALIEQGMWYKEISEFLSCDDCYQRLDHYSSSAPSYNQTMNGTASYWMDKGNRSYLAGSFDVAEESYAQAVKLDPSLLEGWINMGNALFFLGRYQEASDAFDAALRLEPQNANALQGKSRSLLALNRTSESNSTSGMARLL